MIAVRHPSGRSVIPEDAQFLGDFIEAHKPETQFRLRLEKYRKPRSRGRHGEDGNQLGYFFGVMVEKVRTEILHCLKKEEAYYFILENCSYVLTQSAKGKPMKKLRHVDDSMPSDEMSRLITTVLMWAAIEHGCFIEDPDPRKSKRWRAKFLAEGYGVLAEAAVMMEGK